jgi:GH25 family lysozyme M1 (1,4-beta-N-acetylmuramidase)
MLCRVDLWQYTDQGSVPGIKGNVDIDLMFTDYGLGKEIFGDK